MNLRALAVAATLAVLTLAGCAGEGGGEPSPSPPATGLTLEGLVFALGPGAKNVLDTTRGTFTKDMILASPLTVPMTLTDEEMARIARKVDEIDFFSYPESYVTPDYGGGALEPHNTYIFRITTREGTKVVEWEDGLFNDDERAGDLRSLARLIEGIIMAKPEYKRLPPPEGGYV